MKLGYWMLSISTTFHANSFCLSPLAPTTLGSTPVATHWVNLAAVQYSCLSC